MHAPHCLLHTWLAPCCRHARARYWAASSTPGGCGSGHPRSGQQCWLWGQHDTGSPGQARRQHRSSVSWAARHRHGSLILYACYAAPGQLCTCQWPTHTSHAGPWAKCPQISRALCTALPVCPFHASISVTVKSAAAAAAAADATAWSVCQDVKQRAVSKHTDGSLGKLPHTSSSLTQNV